MKQSKDKTISVRVSEITKNAISARARKFGMSLSDYIIYISLGELDKTQQRLFAVFEQEREITKRLDKLCKAFSDRDIRNIQFEEVRDMQIQIKKHLLLLTK